MSRPKLSYVGEGIYGVGDASRITRIPKQKVYRWLCGGSTPPVLQHQFKPIGNRVIVSFKDLIQLRFVDFFRSRRISLQAIRVAVDHVSRLLHSTHPFCSARFKTDGVNLLAEITETDGRSSLIELRDMQHVFRDVIAPFLEELEYKEDIVSQWWPMGRDGGIVIDPNRNFGEPTVAECRYPTRVIYAAYLACTKDVASMASQYEISMAAIEEAVAYEESLAA